ncbi:MAG: hypothetical protein ACK6EB_40235, partial [Planctomyces sp.]
GKQVRDNIHSADVAAFIQCFIERPRCGEVYNLGGGPDNSQAWPVGFSEQGISEEYSTVAPVSLYGATKLASEALALEYGCTFDFPVWINRCGVLAG